MLPVANPECAVAVGFILTVRLVMIAESQQGRRRGSCLMVSMLTENRNLPSPDGLEEQTIMKRQGMAGTGIQPRW